MNETSYFRVKVYRGSCYGSPALTIEMKFSSGEKISCEVSEGLQKRTFLVARADVERLLAEILEITEKTEILSDLRSANVSYHAEIDWENLTFIEGKNSGEFKSFSNEWFIDQIEEFIEYEAETPEIAERMRKILDTKPHRHALEIYRAVKDFSKKYLM